MKQIVSVAALLGLTILLTSAITFMDTPQDPPKKAQKHISMVRVENGEETKIDTVISADQVFVWNGDTIGGEEGLKWISKGGEFDFDSTFNFDFDVKDMGNGQVFVVKSGDKSAPAVFEFESDGKDISWSSKDDENVFFSPGTEHRMMFVPEAKSGNVIDLSDPGIISYEKKELKNGKEKIVIVREKPVEKELHEEIIMNGGAPIMMRTPHPAIEKRIEVISDVDGNVKVMGDGGVWNMKKSEGDVKVIEKDGKKIIIRKSKEGAEMKVNVEVEENEEQE